MPFIGKTRKDSYNFNGGEISPLLASRVDLDMFGRGCRQLQNATPRSYGNAERRTGTQFIAECKYSDKTTILMEFSLSASKSILIEVGHLYMRFFTEGGVILGSGTTPYEIVTPFEEDELRSLRYKQINDVIYITSGAHPPQKLSHYADNNWTIVAAVFDEPPFMDENVTATKITPSATTGSVTLTSSSALFNAQHVGSYWRLGHNRPSASVKLTLISTAASSALKILGAFNLSTTGKWTGTLELQRSDDGSTGWETVYTFTVENDRNLENEYKQEGGYKYWRLNYTYAGKDSSTPSATLQAQESIVYGYAKVTAYTSATSVTATVIDEFQAATATKIWHEGSWSPYRGYPKTCAFFQSRMFYGSTFAQPQTFWASAKEDYHNFQWGTDDDDAFTQTIASTTRLEAQWLEEAASSLIMGSNTSEHSISGTSGGDDPVTPTSLQVRRQSTTGNANCRAIPVGNAIIHLQRNGEKFYEFTYSIQSYGYDDADITQFAEHITESGVIDLTYQRQPNSILWAVRNDGVLLSCVYDQTQKVIAWSRHVTQGSFEAVASIFGSEGDEVWFVVKRVLGNGAVKRNIERLYPIPWTDRTDMWFVDAGLTNVGFEYLNINLSDLDERLTTQPDSIFGHWEDVKTMSVVVNSIGDASFRWQKSLDSVTFEDIPGADANELYFASLTPLDAGYYRCIISDLIGDITSDVATVECVVHAFSYEGEGLGGMGTYAHYDQREDFTTQAGRSFFIGITDTSTVYRDDVFAWAKGVVLNSSPTHGNDFYVGCYGARGCSLVIQNCTGFIGSLYVSSGSAFDQENNAVRVSRNNSVSIIGGNLTNTGGEWLIPGFPWDPVAGQDMGDNLISLSGGAIVNMHNSVSVGLAGWRANTDAPRNHLVITGEGTTLNMVRIDSYDGETPYYRSASIGLCYGADSGHAAQGNVIELSNGALLVTGRRGTSADNDSSLLVIGASAVYGEGTITYPTAQPDDCVLRFGGGFLAYWGDVRGPYVSGSSLSYYHWVFDDSGNQIIPLKLLQVRDSSGMWRAAVAQDFTLTYCVTDADGLAATGGRYTGLAGYTVISTGA